MDYTILILFLLLVSLFIKRVIDENWLLIFIILLILLQWHIYPDLFSCSNNKETFDKDMRIFLPEGEKRYDLRGYPINERPPDDCMFSKDCYIKKIKKNLLL
jgi:hypothetical protein